MTQPLCDPPHAAFYDFREATQGLTELPEDEQVLILKYELFQALERAVDFQDRSRDVERQLEQAKAEAGARADEHRAFATHAARELVSVKVAYEEQLNTVHDAYLAMKRRCATLDEICRSLLLTIERAACPDGSSDLPVAARESACASA